MKLYVCYGTFTSGAHPCGVAHKALVEAGHDPDVKLAFGWRLLPDALNQTAGRKRAKELTGESWVPVLELDDGTAVGGSQNIVAWAKANPAGASTPAGD